MLLIGGEEPVDNAKYAYASLLLPPLRDQPIFNRLARKNDPRSEIAATLHCLVSA